ncbi:nuclear mitotic apparatus protein 1 [Chanos chanos]|uniref:Nuclear mitotic apparatus protein 1 n=1 Tax=Chanos chanos TaxID=29144 RepID=A0A6J2VMS4_CHACN|nr:nuclear mitotic apparatus protein 1 [Chanos chanos]
MALSPAKENALLGWINSLKLDRPADKIVHLADGRLLLKIVCKLQHKEASQSELDLPQDERLKLVSDFMKTVKWQYVCVQMSAGAGRNLELELSKVVLLLCFHGVMNNLTPITKLEFETECEIASLFRFVLKNEDSLYLSDELDRFLTRNTVFDMSSSSSISDDESPVFSRRPARPAVRFLELTSVGSSSASSPIQEVLNTPQVQLRRLRRELAQQGDVRDELEREIASHIHTIEERESQIAQLQHRLQRMLRDHEQLERDHKALLLELQQKNDGLLRRVHEVLKQCQDLKTDNSQMERKISQLTEENGTLSAQMRSIFSRLTVAEEEVTKLMVERDSSRAEWESKKNVLESELGQVISQKEYLTEQIQILEEKISVLEEELGKACTPSQEEGEVLGPILEEERLKQEVADLTLKLSQVQDTVSELEREKCVLAEERGLFEKETQRLERVVSDLQQLVDSLRVERENLAQTSKEQIDTLTAQITSLEADVAHVKQLERQLAAEVTVSAALRREHEDLERKVESLEEVINSLNVRCQILQTEKEGQQSELDTIQKDLQDAKASLIEYEQKALGHQKMVEENVSLQSRISALDDTVTLLQNELDIARKKDEELLAAKVQREAQMNSQLEKQEQKAQEMFAELETLGQEFHKMKQRKLQAESRIEQLTEEAKELVRLVKERDDTKAQLELVEKAKDAAESHLQGLIQDHHTQISQLQSQIEGAVESLQKRESELGFLKAEISAKEEETRMQCEEAFRLKGEVEELHTQLMEEEANSQKVMQELDSRGTEVRKLKNELQVKEDEIRSLKISIQSAEEKATEMHSALQRELGDQRKCIVVFQQQLADAEKLIDEKVKAFEDVAREVQDLRKELSLEREKNETLEHTLKVSRATIEERDVQIEALNKEADQLNQENGKRTQDMEQLQKLVDSLKEEKVQSDTQVVQAFATIKSLQAEVFVLTSAASKKDLDLKNLEEECLSLDQELKRMKECEHERVRIAETSHKVQEETIESLRQKVDSITSDRRQETLALMTQITSLKEELERQQEAEHLRCEEAAALETKHKAMENSYAALQVQLKEANNLVSERHSELLALHKESEENARLRGQEVAELQAKFQEASTLASERECSLHALRTELKEKVSEEHDKAAIIIKEKREEIDGLKAETDRLRSKINILEEVKATELAEKQEKLVQMVKERAETRAELELAEKAKTDMESELQEIIEGHQRQISQLQGQIDGAAESLQQRESEVVVLRAELSAKEHELKVQRQAASQLQSEVEELRKHLAEEEAESQLLDQESKSGRFKIQQLREELGLKEGQIRSLKLERTRHQEQVKELDVLEAKFQKISAYASNKESLSRDLTEQLQAKTVALEHYKSQLENAKNHYNGKKQQLLEAQEKIQGLEDSLEHRETELKTLREELKSVTMELDQAKATERNLTAKVNSLQAQVDYADRALRRQRQPGEHVVEMQHKESVHCTETHQNTSTDSLELDDSLNDARKPSNPGESSTPLPRSSDRLAAKRALAGESLETLFFTPMSTRDTGARVLHKGGVERKLESSITSFSGLALDSAKKLPSSGQRRRTTQVINITMTQKTPGRAEGGEEFYRLHSAQSQPALASQRDRPVSLDFSDDTSTDPLLGLPGYRRSTVHSTTSQRSSTMYLGTENEPEGSADDWLRIAELQARNKSCLPHLKSSYPLEGRPSLGVPSFSVTDEEVRTGDPDETLRRASMVPGQISDSVASHRLSLAVGSTSSLPHRTSMVPGQIMTRMASSRAAHLPKSGNLNGGQNVARGNTASLKRRGTEIQGPDTPEAKKLASCFPRPMTPKDKNIVRFGSANSQNKPPFSPGNRRESMMFTIENTPRKNGKSILQRGMDKIRSSSRKSPGAISRGARSASGKSPRAGKSPAVEKIPKKSPRTSNKTPKIPNSAKKVNMPKQKGVLGEGSSCF